MKISLPAFEASESLKAMAKARLAIPHNVVLDFGLDGLHALNEMTRSIADTHPHKRSIATLGAQPPPLRDVVKNFARQGYTVQEIPCDLTQKTSLVTALETLKKDTLFVLSAEIEPITGVFYPVKVIRDEIVRKNIFLFTYQSPASLMLGMKVPGNPLEGTIVDPLWGEPNGLSLILKGERCTGEPLLWGEPTVNKDVVSKLCVAIEKAKGSGDEKVVLEFEEKMEKKFSGKIKTLHVDARLFDRAVVFVKSVNGDAIVHELEKDGISSSTSDSCYWQDPNLNTWLPKLGFILEDSQTSLVLSLEAIKNPKAFDTICKAIEKFQKISGN